MARVVLSILITIVTSKSAFSKGDPVLSKYRSFILYNHVKLLICTQSWLYRFYENPSGKFIYYCF